MTKIHNFSGEYGECRLQLDQKMGYIIPDTVEGLDSLLKVAFYEGYIRALEDGQHNKFGGLDNTLNMYRRWRISLGKHIDDMRSKNIY